METILFINACMRGRELSRTFALADVFLNEYQAQHDCQLQEVDLAVRTVDALNAERLARRDDALLRKDWTAPELELALQFAAADTIVIAAPFWDLSFPAALKAYLENVSANNVTFAYGEDGKITGCCRAGKLIYITTRGGLFSSEAMQPYEMAVPYLKALGKFFGIPDFHCLYAEGLDLITQDAEAILTAAKEQAVQAARQW